MAEIKIIISGKVLMMCPNQIQEGRDPLVLPDVFHYYYRH